MSQFPWWARMLVGTCVLAFAYYKLPLMEIAVMFLYAVMIPLALLSAVGLVSSGTIEGFSNVINASTEEYARRVRDYRDRMTSPDPYPEEYRGDAAQAK